MEETEGLKWGVFSRPLRSGQQLAFLAQFSVMACLLSSECSLTSMKRPVTSLLSEARATQPFTKWRYGGNRCPFLTSPMQRRNKHRVKQLTVFQCWSRHCSCMWLSLQGGGLLQQDSVPGLPWHRTMQTSSHSLSSSLEASCLACPCWVILLDPRPGTPHPECQPPHRLWGTRKQFSEWTLK